eukprot:evm.model.scf_1699.1 EVM.evm.TU.scf_1699.1   scf_1699:12197-31250(-)
MGLKALPVKAMVSSEPPGDKGDGRVIADVDVGELSEISVTAAMNIGGSFFVHPVSSVAVKLGKVDCSIPFDTVLQLALCIAERKTKLAKGVKGLPMQQLTTPPASLVKNVLQLLPNEVVLETANISVAAVGLGTADTGRVSCHLDGIHLSSKLPGDSHNVCLSGNIGPLKARVSVEDSQTAIKLIMPLCTTSFALDWCEFKDRNVFSVSSDGTVDSHGLKLSASDEHVWDFIRIALGFVQRWEHSHKQLTSRQSGSGVEEICVMEGMHVADGCEVDDQSGKDDGKKGTETLEGKDPGSLLEEDQLLAATKQLLKKTPISTGDVDGDTGQVLAASPGNVGADAIPLQLQGRWNITMKLSQELTVELMENSDPLCTLHADTLSVACWRQRPMPRVDSGLTISKASERTDNLPEDISTDADVHLELAVNVVDFAVACKPLEKNLGVVSLAGLSKVTLGCLLKATLQPSYTVHVDGILMATALQVNLSKQSVLSIVATAEHVVKKLMPAIENIWAVSEQSTSDNGVDCLAESRSRKKVTVDWSGTVEGAKVSYETDFALKDNQAPGMSDPHVTVELAMSQVQAAQKFDDRGAKIDVKDMAIDFYIACAESSDVKTQEKIDVLTIERLGASFERKSAGIVGYLKATKGHVRVHVDQPLVGLQIAHDAVTAQHRIQDVVHAVVHWKTKADVVLNDETEHAVGKLQMAPADCEMSPMTRESASTAEKGPNVAMEIEVQEIAVEAAVGELDTLTVFIRKAFTRTDAPDHRVHAEYIQLLVNGKRVVESINTSVRVHDPAPVTHLDSKRYHSGLQRGKRLSQVEELAAERALQLAHAVVGEGSPLHSMDGHPLSPPLSVSSEHFDRSSSESPASVAPRSLKHSSSVMAERRRQAYNRLGVGGFIELGNDGVLPSILSLEISTDSVCMAIPPEEHVGRVIMFSELWLSAAKQVVAAYVQQLISTINQKHAQQQGSKVPNPRPACVEIWIRAKSLGFRVEAHPLEQWMALHGVLLRKTVLQQHLWSCDSHGNEENVAHGSEGDKKKGSDGLPEHQRAQKAKEWASIDVFHRYKEKCTEIKSGAEEMLHHRGALLHVAMSHVDALIIVGDKSCPEVVEAAVKNIREFDKPSSDSVLFSNVQPLFLSVQADNMMGYIGGLETANIPAVAFTGVLVRGRQLTHPPQTMTMTFKVGRWHSVDQSHPIKGARPPMKVYTSMEASLDSARIQGGIGLEPVIAQMAVAFNRLVPPNMVNSNGTLQQSSTPVLRPWDKTRYMWRGTMKLHLNQLQAAVSTSIDPMVCMHTERVELGAGGLHVNVIAGGVNVEADDLRITLYKSSLRSAPDDLPQEFLLAVLPCAKMQFRYNWKMPFGRNPIDHYAYPVVSQCDESLRLAPVDLVRLFRGEGYEFCITANLKGKERSVGETIVDDEVPVIVMGEPHIRFLIDMVECMESPPIYIRGAWKQGTYFVKKGASLDAGPPLPKLLHKVCVSAEVQLIEVKHNALDADDPGHDVWVCCESVRFAGTWAFMANLDRLQRVKAGEVINDEGYVWIDGLRRRRPRVKSPPDMENLEVEAFQIRGYLPDQHATHPLVSRTQSLDEQNSLLRDLLHQVRQPSRVHLGASMESTTPAPDGLDGHILSATAFLLRQLSPQASTQHDRSDAVQLPSGETKRPLRIAVMDVKALMPKEVQDAVFSVFVHMAAAFSRAPQAADLTVETSPSQGPKRQPSVPQPTSPMEERQEDSLLSALLLQDPESIENSPDEAIAASMSTQGRDHAIEGSKLILELEFTQVQLNLATDVSEGCVVLALDSGVLKQHFNEEHHEQIMRLSVDHVQAYVMDTTVDPHNPVRWLEVSNGQLCVPPDSMDMLQRIVKPFSVSLSLTGLLVTGQALFPDRPAEDLELVSPEIVAQTEREQFEIIVDVINTAMHPLPTIKCVKDTVLGPTGSTVEDANLDIIEAKSELKSLYVKFNALRQEAYAVWTAGDEGSVLHTSQSVFLGDKGLDELPSMSMPASVDPQQEVNSLLQSVLEKADGMVASAPGEENIAQKLLHWKLEQKIRDALKDCKESAKKLSIVRKRVLEENKHKRLYKSMHMRFACDQITWQLTKDGEKFMQAQIQGFSYTSTKNKDLSGESKMSVHRIELRDLQNLVGETPSLDRGVVLSVLQPASASEEMIRGLFVRGGQTSSLIYYEHIEVWVHPLGLHFTEQAARELSAYFFPAESTHQKKKQQEDWAKAVTRHPQTSTQLSTAVESESEIEVHIDTADFMDGSTSPSDEPEERSRSSTTELTSSMFQNQQTNAQSLQTKEHGDPVEPPSFLMTPPSKKAKGLCMRQKLHFVHFRFNRVVTQITYEGMPFSFADLKIKLDTAEYNHMEGQWVNVLNRYKNNVITSVLKSVASSMGRKFVPPGSTDHPRSGRRILGKIFHRKKPNNRDSDEFGEDSREDADNLATVEDDGQHEEKASKSTTKDKGTRRLLGLMGR